MRLSHLEALRPICPSCRGAPVALSHAIRADGRDVEEGLLVCGAKACQHEFPIVDGIPLLVRGLRKMVSDQVLPILARSDLSETTLASLAECCGPSSALDVLRQHLSTYVWCHYHDLDPEEAREDPPARSTASILEAGLDRLAASGRPLEGPIADLGCSVGRSTLHLAARTAGAAAPLVLGLDLSFSMLRVARRALLEKRVRYARRRVGLVYDERSFEIPVEGAERVDFWCVDALALPFSDATFGTAFSLNLIDCVPSPLDHLRTLCDAVRPGGTAVVATPFDWQPTATAVEAWIGGHSPRGTSGGRSEHILRSLLGGDHPNAIPGLRVADAAEGIEWSVRLHERSRMRYLVDMFVLERPRH